MNIKNEKEQLVGVAVIYKVSRGKPVWFICKQNQDSDWELARTMVRRGESSVRSVLRLTVEQALMRTRVLEEAHRAVGALKLNGRTIAQKLIYYLLVQKDAGEIIGFADFAWLEYSKAIKKLANKKDQAALKGARDVLKEIEKKSKKK